VYRGLAPHFGRYEDRVEDYAALNNQDWIQEGLAAAEASASAISLPAEDPDRRLQNFWDHVQGNL
jgi:hypothetical protein